MISRAQPQLCWGAASSPIPQLLESWRRLKCGGEALSGPESVSASFISEPNLMLFLRTCLWGSPVLPLQSPLLGTNKVLIRNHLARARAGRRPRAPVLSQAPSHSPQALGLKILSYQDSSQSKRVIYHKTRQREKEQSLGPTPVDFTENLNPKETYLASDGVMPKLPESSCQSLP